jgi:hypothetical protein
VHGTIEIWPGGIPVHRKVDFQVSEGRNELFLSVPNEGKLRLMLPHIAKRLGISIEEARAVLRAGTSSQHYEFTSRAHYSRMFGSERAQRSMVKMFLVLIAQRLGVDRVRRFDAEHSIRFLQAGSNYPGTCGGWVSLIA